MAGLAMATFFFRSARADEEVRDLNKKFITNVQKEELREIGRERASRRSTSGEGENDQGA
jgi:hypothetical protein